MIHVVQRIRLVGTLLLLGCAFGWAQEEVPLDGGFSFAGEDALVIYDIVDDRLVNPIWNPVSEDLEAFQSDVEHHRFLWEFFATIIPAEVRFDIVRFSVFSDEGALAMVEPFEDRGLVWTLAINIDVTEDLEEALVTILHEFGHVLTLGTGEVDPGYDLLTDSVGTNNEDYERAVEEAAAACDTYFARPSCSFEDSYINLFFEIFWADIYEEAHEIGPDELYERYPDAFVDAYAATDPAEDIAESWARFVLDPPPQSDAIASDKVRFFYTFPELVALREVILYNIDEILAEPE